MKITKEGKDLTKLVFTGECKFCGCCAEVEYKEVRHLVLDAYRKILYCSCPNCGNNMRLIDHENKIPSKVPF